MILQLAAVLVVTAQGSSPVDDDRLNDLLVRYKTYGLPLPGPGAELVSIESSQIIYGPGIQPPLRFTYRVGDQILSGYDLRPIEDHESTAPLPELPESVAKAVPYANNWCLAMTALSRGKRELCRKLLESELKENPYTRNEEVYDVWAWQPEGSPEQRLAMLAIGRLAWKSLEKGQPYAEILKATLAISGTLPDKEHPPLLSAFLADLRASAAPNLASKGSPEWIVNELTESKFDAMRFGTPVGDERFKRFEEGGFSMIPTAIAHLKDRRFTRVFYLGGGPQPSTFLRVEDLVASFLRFMSNGRLEGRINSEKAQAWWSIWSKRDETEFLAEHALPSDATRYGASLPAKLLAKRSPARFRKVLERALSENFRATTELLTSLELAGFNKPDRIEFLQRAMNSQQGEVVSTAYGLLRDTDESAGRAALSGAVNSLKSQKARLGVFNTRETTIPQLVRTSGSEKHLKELEEVLGSVDADMRAAIGMSVGTHRYDLNTKRTVFVTEAAALIRRLLSDPAPVSRDFRLHWGQEWLSGLRVKDAVAFTYRGFLTGREEGAPPVDRDAFCSQLDTFLAAAIKNGGTGSE